MEFSNREIATGILIALGLILVVVFPKTRRAFLKGIVDVLKALFQWKLLLLFALYFLYAIALVVVAKTQDWWDTSLLSVTTLTVVVTGIPVFMNANNYTTGSELVRKVVFEVVGLSALLVTYLNLGEFPIWGELILQVVLFFLVALVTIAPRNSETRVGVRLLEIVLSLVVIGLLISTTVTVLSGTKSFDWLQELKAFTLSVWLPITLIPFVYVAALFMSTEQALVRLKIHNNRHHPALRVRWALILGFRGSLRYANSFNGLWIVDMASQQTFRSGLSFMGKYRKAVQVRAAEQRTRDRLFRELTGQRGVDDQGLWLDRREFYETRKVLETAWFTQAAIFRNGGKYLNETFLLSSFHLDKLPKDHGFEIALAKSARSWYAWRKTAGGYYFGTGGTKDVDARWQYNGTEPPTDFPRNNASGWVNSTQDDENIEWSTDKDQPFPPV